MKGTTDQTTEYVVIARFEVDVRLRVPASDAHDAERIANAALWARGDGCREVVQEALHTIGGDDLHMQYEVVEVDGLSDAIWGEVTADDLIRL